MFGLVLTAGYTLMLAYIFWRLAGVPTIAVRVGRTGIWATAAVLWFVFVVARYGAHDETGWLALAVETAGMVLLAAAFIIFMCLLVVDVVTLFGFVLKRWVGVLRLAGLAAGAVLSGLALIQGLRAPEVETYEVTVPDLPQALDGTRIVAMSDLHVGGLRDSEWLENRVAEVAALKPDALVLVGDTLEGHSDEIVPNLAPLANLATPMGKWFVYGNHDMPRAGREVTAPLSNAGLELLANDSVELAPGLVLAGVTDLTWHRHSDTEGSPMAEALKNSPNGVVVLLSHSPLQAGEAAARGADLMISGHTHGGQIWPFSLFVQRMYPYISGLYEVEGMHLIVNRGTGLWGPPMRLWSAGEISLVVLRSSKGRQ